MTTPPEDTWEDPEDVACFNILDENGINIADNCIYIPGNEENTQCD